MPGKPWDRALVGPRIPLSADGPVNGCMNGCGENRPSMLRTYALVLDGRVWGRWRLCADCLVWGTGHPDPDPLHVEVA